MITLEEAKRQLIIEADNTTDDDYITSLIEVVESAVLSHLDYTEAELIELHGEFPAPCKQAMLLLLSNFYANREPIAFASSNVLSFSYKYLLDLYKRS